MSTSPLTRARGPLGRGRCAVALALGALLLVALAPGCEEPKFQAPPEAPEDPSLPPTRLNLPRPPRILKPRVPERYPDGSLSIDGLRRKAAQLARQDVQVRGFVEEIYVCPWAEEEAALAKAREVARRRRKPAPKPETEHPPCKEPHFFLTDEPGARRKLLVVGYNPEELKEPEKGQQLVAGGKFAHTSVEGFIASEGLLRLTTWGPYPPPPAEDKP